MLSENKLVHEVEELNVNFTNTMNKLVKDIKRQDKIMYRADKRQQKEYDELLELQEAQKKLMDSFIKLIAGAIDAKSAYTGGHCARVPELSLMLAEVASQSQEGIFADFSMESEDEKRELSIASWLHDCGKVTTPEYVVDKATKLETIYNRIHEVRTRFEVIHRDYTIEALQKKASGADVKEVDEWLEVEHKKLQDEFDFIATSNVGGEFMSKDSIQRVKEIGSRVWSREFDDTKGLTYEEEKRMPSMESNFPHQERLLSDKSLHIIPRTNFNIEEYEKSGFKSKVPKHLYNLGEIYNLSVERGTLTEEERFKINEHVIMSIKMLEQLPFPPNLKNVPLYAGAHHETLIGTGYPRELTKKDMPIPARIMAIADVFEALTASDRPYKTPKSLSASIKILSFMAKDEHIDADLFKLFLSSGIYLEYAKAHLKPEQIDKVDIEQYLK